MNIKQNRLNKPTGRRFPRDTIRDYNNQTNTSDLNKQICLSAEMHPQIEAQVLLERVVDQVFVDLPKICTPCKDQTRLNYAIGVNARRISYPYELFQDTTIDTTLENIISSSKFIDNDQKSKLQKLQEDLRAYNREKKYDVVPVTDGQKLTHLEKQNWPIADFRNDPSTTIKFVITFPIGRQFTLPSEVMAINTLSTVPVETNVLRSQFVIYKDKDNQK